MAAYGTKNDSTRKEQRQVLFDWQPKAEGIQDIPGGVRTRSLCDIPDVPWHPAYDGFTECYGERERWGLADEDGIAVRKVSRIR